MLIIHLEQRWAASKGSRAAKTTRWLWERNRESGEQSRGSGEQERAHDWGHNWTTWTSHPENPPAWEVDKSTKLQWTASEQN